MTQVEHQNVTVLSDDELRTLDAHWRAANYLAAGQIYLMANPLLTEPLLPEHIKPRLLGQWGTSPGLNLVHTHFDRVIKARDLDALCVWGPGQAGRPCRPAPDSTAATARPPRTSPATPPAWSGSSGSSPSPAA